MCGIIAIVRRPDGGDVVAAEAVIAPLRDAMPAVDGLDPTRPGADLATALGEAAARLEQADMLLRGVAGVRALLADRELGPTATGLAQQVTAAAATVEELGGGVPSEAVPARRGDGGHRRLEPRHS